MWQGFFFVVFYVLLFIFVFDCCGLCLVCGDVWVGYVYSFVGYCGDGVFEQLDVGFVLVWYVWIFEEDCVLVVVFQYQVGDLCVVVYWVVLVVLYLFVIDGLVVVLCQFVEVLIGGIGSYLCGEM